MWGKQISGKITTSSQIFLKHKTPADETMMSFWTKSVAEANDVVSLTEDWLHALDTLMAASFVNFYKQ